MGRKRKITGAEVTAIVDRQPKRKPEPTGDPREQFFSAVQKVRTAYGDGVLRSGASFPILERIPCGIFALDHAIGVSGGTVGFPRGRVSLVAGQESTCKTLICLWLMAEFQRRGEPVVYVDAEKSWDREWATHNGVDVDKVLVEPSENAERTLDILAEFIRVMPDGLVVVDSLAALTPSVEIEKSFTEWQQGYMARLAAKAFRSVQSGQNSAATEFLTHGCTVVMVQQFRTNIATGGKVMPGGQAQLFAGSVIVNLRGGQKVWHIPGKGEVESATLPKEANAICTGRIFNFEVAKNKTSAPYRHGEFKFYTTRYVDHEIGADITAGTTNTEEQLVRAGVLVGAVERQGSWYSFAGERLGNGMSATVEALEDPALYARVYQAVLECTVRGVERGSR